MRMRGRFRESQLSVGVVDEVVHPPRLVARFPAIGGAESSGFADDMTYWVGALTDDPEVSLGSDPIGLNARDIATDDPEVSLGGDPIGLNARDIAAGPPLL